MYRNFLFVTVEDNRDQCQRYAQVYIPDGGDIAPVLKLARIFAREHGIRRVPPFVEIDRRPRLGIELHALSTSQTGVIVCEVFV